MKRTIEQGRGPATRVRSGREPRVTGGRGSPPGMGGASVLRLVLTLGLLGMALAEPVAAQRTETLVGRRAHNGGFGGPVMKVGELFGEPVLFMGGRGAWVAGRAFALGGGGYALVNDNIGAPAIYGGRRPTLEMGYGGLEMEYLHESHRLAHLSIYTLMGAGGVRYRDREVYETVDSDGYLVMEPGLNMTLNVTEFLRLSAGGTYRWTWGVELPGLSDQDLSGPTGMFTIRFGRY